MTKLQYDDIKALVGSQPDILRCLLIDIPDRKLQSEQYPEVLSRTMLQWLNLANESLKVTRAKPNSFPNMPIGLGIMTRKMSVNNCPGKSHISFGLRLLVLHPLPSFASPHQLPAPFSIRPAFPLLSSGYQARKLNP